MTDPTTPTTEDLLAHSTWVRDLSRRLVHDPNEADDLVQDAAVAALESTVAPRSIKAWLGSVLMNRAREVHRGEARRRSREAAAGAPGSAPSTLDIVERAATHHAVVQAVLALHEPYRTTVLLRFFDDLPPRKIAKQLDVPVSTVNTRLQRGLDRLRVELDLRYGHDRTAWTRALVLLIGPTSGFFAAALSAVLLHKGIAMLLTSLLVLVSLVLRAGWLDRSSDPEPVVAAAPSETDNGGSDPSDEPDPQIVRVPAGGSLEVGRGDGSSGRVGPAPATPDALDRTELTRAALVARIDGASPSTLPAIPGMVAIPAGTAVIGMTAEEVAAIPTATPAEQSILQASVPRHAVEVDAFYLDRTEVTNGQWAAYLAATGAEPSDELVQYRWKADAPAPEALDEPVGAVSFDEAAAFAEWAGKRLPNEVEWEYAARGEEGRVYPWGDTFDESRVLSDRTRKGRRGAVGPEPVATHPGGRTPEGAFDLAGNVWEWTSSRFAPYAGGDTTSNELFSPARRVVRGGAWDSNPVVFRSAVRQFAERATWFGTLGFRCARSARPGEDAVVRALEEVGPEIFREHPLDRGRFLVLEETRRDADGWIVGHDELVLAPVAAWNTPAPEETETPLPVALLTTTVPLREPALEPGSYVVLFDRRDGRDTLRFVDAAQETRATVDASPAWMSGRAAAAFVRSFGPTLQRLDASLDVAMPIGGPLRFTLELSLDAGAFPARLEAGDAGDASATDRHEPPVALRPAPTVRAPTPGSVKPSSGAPRSLGLDDADVARLRNTAAAYFRARLDNDFRGMASSYTDLERSFHDAAAKYGSSLLASPADLRDVLSVPLDPARSPPRGCYHLVEFETTLPGNTESFGYLLRVPRSYRAGVPSPVVVALPPAGARRNDLRHWARDAVPAEVAEQALVVVPAMPEAAGGDWRELHGRMSVFFALRNLYMSYEVDRFRIALAATGDDAMVAVSYASWYPGIFAGLVFRAPTTAVPDDVGLPALVVRAERDDERFASFVVETRKPTAPRAFRFTTTGWEFPSAWWLRLDDFEASDASPLVVEGAVDRTTNTITVVTSRPVESFTVFVNDELVDLSRYVTVQHVVGDRATGTPVVRYRGTAAPDLEHTLTGWFECFSGHLGEAYTNWIAVEGAPASER